MMHRLTLHYFIFLCVSYQQRIYIHNIAKINQDFESQVLQEEWSNYRSLHLQRHHQRENTTSQRITHVQEKIDNFTKQAKSVHDTLDNMVD